MTIRYTILYIIVFTSLIIIIYGFIKVLSLKLKKNIIMNEDMNDGKNNSYISIDERRSIFKNKEDFINLLLNTSDNMINKLLSKFTLDI